ncbi:MAG: hypothetical protein ACQUHE_06140 [Bacteroidia bacterium]
MKQLIFMLAFLCCMSSVLAKAQTINRLKLSELGEEYLQVDSYKPSFSTKTIIALDYGQDRSNSRDLFIKDANGENFEYNSVIEFLNIMKKHGYELFQVYTTSSNGDSSTKYILKRKSS